MSKSLISLILPLVLASQAQASAFDSLNDQKLQEQAMALLKGNAAAIEMTGDVHPHEKLSDIIKEIDLYNEELLSRIADGQDIENMKSRIRSVDTKCIIQQSEKAALCDLMIIYRLGDQNINFKVLLNAENNAIAIENKVVVSRGD